ncbi:protein SCAI [Pectinophora gossypiella]|uniref:protein SCAI n=1 Tax=Pectinophora gossypiella TaxID=13191 RepID=UPI00214DFC9B|nr:protein SCAI [Pectinophora gossypiella]
MGRMERNALDEHERKIIIEFCHLLEKSKQLFNGLRELPQYGHKQWHSYFGRTFDVYTKLWKFQQQHRAVLDSKYGLKRWQIGEIASKIGQLYYHFYLRTSETNYLNEAFSFYYAIRGRCYYTKACKEDKCELMVKKLRYYARFIVVCLLLKKIKLVKELIKELDRQIVEYGNTYDPDDQIEWTVVVDEVKAFIQAEPIVSVIHPDNYPVVLSHRLCPVTTPPVERSPQMNLTLLEVLIVGSSSQQVKFSELTMDMFRMLQTLEREPSGEIQHMYDDSPRQRFISTPNAPTAKGYNLENGPRTSKDNPHKYLLFKPSPSQVLVYLASGCNDLPPGGALLLYISADGQIVQSSKHPEDLGYDTGGLITTSKTDIYRDCNKDPKAGPPPNKHKELQCLHPGDLHPFTRRPLFMIIDSDNSYVFQHIPRHFGQPLVILMSPLELPAPFTDRRQQGSLFTLFLHSPLTAICYLCDIHTMPLVHWDRGQVLVDTFMGEASTLITRTRIDINYLVFMGDDFLRLLLLRFIFCEVTLRLHRSFRARTHLPRSSPPIPEDILEHPTLIHIILDVAAHLQVRSHFHDPSAGGGGGGGMNSTCECLLTKNIKYEAKVQWRTEVTAETQ